MSRTPYNLFIGEPASISLDYSVPDHLKKINSTEDLREADLTKFDSELRRAGSSLDEKISSKVIWRKRFLGMILDVTHVRQDQYGNVTLRVSPIHPHRADLSYKQDKTLPRGVTPLTTGAILLDRKGNVILGVRGGDVECGKVATFPGGHIDFEDPRVEDVNYSLYREYNEELGIDFDQEKDKNSLIGIMGNGDTQGINILNTIQTHRSFEELEYFWRNAKDRFEHSDIFIAELFQLKDLVENGRTTKNDQLLETTPYFQDCLYHYIKTVSRSS